jgi:hypothetical protein
LNHRENQIGRHPLSCRLIESFKGCVRPVRSVDNRLYVEGLEWRMDAIVLLNDHRGSV